MDSTVFCGARGVLWSVCERGRGCGRIVRELLTRTVRQKFPDFPGGRSVLFRPGTFGANIATQVPGFGKTRRPEAPFVGQPSGRGLAIS